MKTGDIIRRVDSAGNFIGKYYIVYKISGNLLYVRDKLLASKKFDPRAKYIVMDKRFCTSLSVIVLKISLEQLKKLKYGVTKEISHEFCTTWDNVHKKTPEIIRFIAYDGNEILYAVLDKCGRFIKQRIVNQNKFGDLTKYDKIIKLKIKHTIL